MQPFNGGYMYGGPQGPPHDMTPFGTGNPYAVPYGYSPYPPGGVPMGYSGPMDMTMMGTGLPMQRPAQSASSGHTQKLDGKGQVSAAQAQLDDPAPLQLELQLELPPAPLLRAPPPRMHGPPMGLPGGPMSSQMPYMMPPHDQYYGYMDPAYGYMPMMDPALYLPPVSRHQYMPPPGAFAPLGPMHLKSPQGLGAMDRLDRLGAADIPLPGLMLPGALDHSTPAGSSTGAGQQQVAAPALPQAAHAAAAALNSGQTSQLTAVAGLEPAAAAAAAAAAGALLSSFLEPLGPVNPAPHALSAQKAAEAAEAGVLTSHNSAAPHMPPSAGTAPDTLPCGVPQRPAPLSTATAMAALYATPHLMGTALCSPRQQPEPLVAAVTGALGGPPQAAHPKPAPPAPAPPGTAEDAAPASAADPTAPESSTPLPASASALLAPAAATRATGGGASAPPPAADVPVHNPVLASVPLPLLPSPTADALQPAAATDRAGPAAAAASAGYPPSELLPCPPAAAASGRQALPPASSCQTPHYGPMVTALLEATGVLPSGDTPLSTQPSCSAWAGTSTGDHQVGAMAAQPAPGAAQACRPTSMDSFQTLDLERATVAKLARVRLQEQREAGNAQKDACRTELLATTGVLVGEPVLARKVIRYKKRGVSINVMEPRGTLTQAGFIQCHCGCGKSHTLTSWEAHCIPKLNRNYVIGQFICFPRLQISMENLAALAQQGDPEGASRSYCRHCWEPECPLTCTACKGSFHTECVKMGKRPPPVHWTCLECSTRPNHAPPSREQQGTAEEEVEVMDVDDMDDITPAAAEATRAAPAAPPLRPAEAPALEDIRPLKRLRTATAHTSSNEDECTPLTIPGDLPDPATSFALLGPSIPAASPASAPPAACLPLPASEPWGTYALGFWGGPQAAAVVAGPAAGAGPAAQARPARKQPTPAPQAAAQEQRPPTSTSSAPTAPPPSAQPLRCQSPATSLPQPPSAAHPREQSTQPGQAPCANGPDPPGSARSPSPFISPPQPSTQPAPGAPPQPSHPTTGAPTCTPSSLVPAHPAPPAVPGGLLPTATQLAAMVGLDRGAQREQQLLPLVTSSTDAAALHYRLQQLENRLAAKNKQLLAADSRCAALQHRAESAEAEASGLRQQFHQAEKDSDTTLRAFQVALAAKTQDVSQRCRQLEVLAAQRASLNHTIFALRMQLSRLNCLVAASQVDPQEEERPAQQQQQAGGATDACMGGKPAQVQVPVSNSRLMEAELQAKQMVIAEKETIIARLRSSHAMHRSGAARDMSRHIQQLQSLSTAALLASSVQEAPSSEATSNSVTARDVAVKLQALTHKISDTASMLANDSDLEAQLTELQQMLRQMQVQGAESMMLAVTEKDKCIAELQSKLMHLKSQMEASSALMLTLQCTVQSNARPLAGQLQHTLHH